MEMRHHLDRRIAERALNVSEVELLSLDIVASARATVVVFIDLTDSTLMKYQRPAQDWIGLVYEFIKRCDFLARARGGTVVKHIGDEVMLTFYDISDTEAFLCSMLTDESLIRYRFKSAVDFGEAYFLHSHHADTVPTMMCPWPAPQDPYGKVIDRCARIISLAAPGTVLCSEDYARELPAGQELRLAGTKRLKGINEPCRIYFRHMPEVEVGVGDGKADLFARQLEN